MDLNYKPCGKACHTSRKSAKKALDKINKEKKHGLKDVYFCEQCQHWHTTSMPKKDSRKLSRHKQKGNSNL